MLLIWLVLFGFLSISCFTFFLPNLNRKQKFPSLSYSFWKLNFVMFENLSYVLSTHIVFLLLPHTLFSCFSSFHFILYWLTCIIYMCYVYIFAISRCYFCLFALIGLPFLIWCMFRMFLVQRLYIFDVLKGISNSKYEKTLK